MQEKLQRFGGAMMQPTLLFPFYGVVLGLISLLTNDTIWHYSDAAKSGFIMQLLNVVNSGGWTIFNVLPPLFAIGLAAGLAKKEKFKAAIAAFLLYATFLVFLEAYMTTFNIGVGPHSKAFPQGVLLGDKYLGKVMTKGTHIHKMYSTLCEAGDEGTKFLISAKDCITSKPSLADYPFQVSHGVKSVLGITGPDMNIVGGLAVASIVVWIHNKFYDAKMPAMLGVFQGMAFVVTIGFFAMLLLAISFAYVWPWIQSGIATFTYFLKKSSFVGVWLYVFLERALLPAGMHHFIYGPFIFGPAVVSEGITPWWMSHGINMTTAAQYKHAYNLVGGFSLHGNSKIFGLPAAALAMIQCADDENKETVKGMLVSAAGVAFITGITEPIEFTFLFLAPQLFFTHAFLGATMATIMFMTGLTGNFGAGLLDALLQNWIPLWHIAGTHYIIQIVIGLVFSVIYYVTFKTMIVKFNLKTPGRGTEAKLFTKKEFREAKNVPEGESETMSPYYQRAAEFLDLVGGAKNVESSTNCATRLRLKIKDPSLASKEQNDYINAGATGVVCPDEHSRQIIVGLDVANVRSEFDELIQKELEKF